MGGDGPRVSFYVWYERMDDFYIVEMFQFGERAERFNSKEYLESFWATGQTTY